MSLTHLRSCTTGPVQAVLCCLCAAAFLLTGFACHSNPVTANGPYLQLKTEYQGVTEVWLHLVAAPDRYAIKFTLTKDGSLHDSINALYLDTVLTIDSLLPKHNYTFKAERWSGATISVASEQLNTSTLDTSSHDLVWRVDTLGDGAASQLYDVAVIGDTLAYAVGELYLKDSTGNFDPHAYNAARWHGGQWELMRISVPLCGSNTSRYFPLNAVYAFGPDDVWFSGGGDIEHWDGSVFTMDCSMNHLINGPIQRLWGSSPDELYAVGLRGTIIHRMHGVWEKLESGTSLDIQDIWGAQAADGTWEVIAAAGNSFVSRDRTILRISDTSVTVLSDNGIDWALTTVWFMPGRYYWVAGDGIWMKRSTLEAPIWQGGPNIITTFVTDRMRGTDVNNIFFCGAYGDLSHFNGISWRSFRQNTALGYGQYYSIAVSKNSVVAVGANYARAVVARGYHP